MSTQTLCCTILQKHTQKKTNLYSWEDIERPTAAQLRVYVHSDHITDGQDTPLLLKTVLGMWVNWIGRNMYICSENMPPSSWTSTVWLCCPVSSVCHCLLEGSAEWEAAVFCYVSWVTHHHTEFHLAGICACMRWVGGGVDGEGQKVGEWKQRTTCSCMHRAASCHHHTPTCPNSMWKDDGGVQLSFPLLCPPYLRGCRGEEQTTAIRELCLEELGCVWKERGLNAECARKQDYYDSRVINILLIRM